MGEFQQRAFSDQNTYPFQVTPDSAFRLFIKVTFGEPFYMGLMADSSDPYIYPTGAWAVDFTELYYPFTLIQLPKGWQLDIKYKGNVAISNQVLDLGLPEEMVLTFHSLKAQMIVELDGMIFNEVRDERNRDIEPVQESPELFLPNTMMRISDWECQLILEFVKSGCEPAPAILKAKHLIWYQLNSPDGEPGNLSIIDRRKSRVDQK